MCTNTPHSISLSANRFTEPKIASIEISGDGTKNVTIKTPLTITGDASLGGTLTTPKLNVFNITTASGTTPSGTTIDGVQIRNGSNQSIVTVYGNTKATLFEGNITCEG